LPFFILLTPFAEPDTPLAHGWGSVYNLPVAGIGYRPLRRGYFPLTLFILLERFMKTSATFYHAGCPVCVDAERQIADALDPDRYDVELVHLGEQKDRIADAEAAGVKSVPALVINGAPFHINFGAPMSALKS
jgi:glutaredoxin